MINKSTIIIILLLKTNLYCEIYDVYNTSQFVLIFIICNYIKWNLHMSINKIRWYYSFFFSRIICLLCESEKIQQMMHINGNKFLIQLLTIVYQYRFKYSCLKRKFFANEKRENATIIDLC